MVVVVTQIEFHEAGTRCQREEQVDGAHGSLVTQRIQHLREQHLVDVELVDAVLVWLVADDAANLRAHLQMINVTGTHAVPVLDFCLLGTTGVIIVEPAIDAH